MGYPGVPIYGTPIKIWRCPKIEVPIILFNRMFPQKPQKPSVDGHPQYDNLPLNGPPNAVAYLDRSLQVLEVPPEAIQEDLEVEPGTRCKFLLLKTRGFFQVTSAAKKKMCESLQENVDFSNKQRDVTHQNGDCHIYI